LKPSDWISKHKEENGKKRGKSAMPEVGTYNPVLDNTFSKVAEDNKKKGSRPKSNYLGTEERFGGSKKGKVPSGPPGPGFYPMLPKWPGKI